MPSTKMLSIFIKTFLMPFLIMEKTIFVKFGLIPPSDIIFLKKKCKDVIVVEHCILFTNDLVYIRKTTR